ncbi:ester cyclase [Ancylomarina sp. DW003]|nr:ester cyclase [Ancylomarina sp. DW003]MDE5421650.1 ester cyclase [Ancylomarina sp. DW003]
MKHTKNYLLIFVLLTLFSSCKNQTVDIEKERQNAVKEYVAKMETERQQKLDVIQKFYEVFASGDMSVLPEILAANYTQYPSDPGQTPDIEGFVKHTQDFGSMFSDLKGVPSHILVDKDLVFVRSELEVTHSGKAFNIPATNKRIKLTAFDLHHFNEDGKIDKTWHLEDFWGAYSQIKK